MVEQTNALGFIVDRLNDEPFKMTLTMVQFDEKSPFELLEVVNEVMAHLSSQHRIDLRDETPEATATRMLDFMRVLNYRPPHALEPQQAKTALLHGEPAFIYPILTWMLQRLPELHALPQLAQAELLTPQRKRGVVSSGQLAQLEQVDAAGSHDAEHVDNNVVCFGCGRRDRRRRCAR